MTDADGDFVSYSVDVLSVILAAARRGHRRGAASHDSHRFRAADRALGSSDGGDSRSRRDRRRQDPARLRQRGSVRRIGRPSRPRERRRCQRRAARHHGARDRARGPRPLGYHARPRGTARPRLRPGGFARGRSRAIAARRQSPTLYRRRNRACRRERAATARRARRHRRRGQLVHRRRPPVVSSGRRARSRHRPHDRLRRRSRSTACRRRALPVSPRWPRNPPAR